MPADSTESPPTAKRADDRRLRSLPPVGPKAPHVRDKKRQVQVPAASQCDIHTVTAVSQWWTTSLSCYDPLCHVVWAQVGDNNHPSVQMSFNGMRWLWSHHLGLWSVLLATGVSLCVAADGSFQLQLQNNSLSEKRKEKKGVVQSGQAPQLATCLLPPGSALFSTSTPFTAARRGWTLGCRTPCAAAAAGCFPRSPPKCSRHSSEAMNSARRLSRASRSLRSPGEDIVH